ncbi:Hypothetical predicted protein [Paramuricea clavata]|uniref:Uncharacterized protein n=1 Tax=Paramuricea clavata TaxID=317549 RepID=A0A6S7J4E5_PARCT|nr:Hypothetical predicted protein [Paramuricea clavata]
MASGCIGPQDNRLVYLVTYSQADLTKFSSREEFAEALVLAFSKDNSVIQCAWQYVTKTNREYSQSDGHPDLTNGEPPKTDSASAAIVEGREESDSEGDDATGKRSRKRKKRLTSLEVADIIQSKSIKTRTQLLAFSPTTER